MDALFEFAHADDMRANRAVEEYLCSGARHTTILHVLFRRGLVGAAEELRMGYTTASDLWEVLLGSASVSYKPEGCTATRMRTAMDGASMAAGIMAIMGASVPAAPVLMGMLGVGVSVGVGAGSYVLSGECAPRAVHK